MMIRRIVISVVALLALGAGVAYAATQLAYSDGTQVCVNQTNGLMRASSTCRDGEYAMTIGGGGNVVVTQNGTFEVAPGQSVSKTLPLTGITVTGFCTFDPAHEIFADMVTARARLDAASGATMDIPSAKVIGGQSWVQGLTFAAATGAYANHTTWVATSRGATATIALGSTAMFSPQKCIFLWQATEAPN